MKLSLLFTTLFFLNLSFAQTPEEFLIEIEPLVIDSAPGVHSFSWGHTNDGKWVVIGGRIDGLHRRQPWAAFLEQDNNKFVFVIDPVSEGVWYSDLSVLSASLYEQLQSTNQQFFQRDSMLYITGGYGYSATAADHITHPYLTAVSVDELANAVINATSITPYFRQIMDLNMKVTGGQLGILNDRFYLVGGNLFDGAYNPMGPNNGPGFVQVYSNDIRAFDIVDDGVNLSIQNYVATHDTINLHRRDYNMAPQVFPNGTEGFTAFSGVFDYNDFPYLNTVDIDETSYSVNNSFNQYLSQYHSAKIPVFDANANTMHTLFFGGLSQYTLDAQNNLVEDQNVPFVKTISRVTRFSNGSMQEIGLDYVEMPTLVGAGAEFIPIQQYFSSRHILDLNAVPQTKTLIGYIYGGIESSAANIFEINDGTQSFASNVIFKVFINKADAGIEETTITGNTVFNPQVYPVPARNKINIDFFAPRPGTMNFTIADGAGNIVQVEEYESDGSGNQEVKLNISKLANGSYTLIISDGSHEAHKHFVKN